MKREGQGIFSRDQPDSHSSTLTLSLYVQDWHGQYILILRNSARDIMWSITSALQVNQLHVEKVPKFRTNFHWVSKDRFSRNFTKGSSLPYTVDFCVLTPAGFEFSTS